MTSPDTADQVSMLRSPFTELLGLQIDEVSLDQVTARLTVDSERHLHPWGAVHGGVYSAIVETLATLGAQLSAIPDGKLASGIENHTSFLRQVREGQLRARATPVSRGRQLHLWSVAITDEQDRLVAQGIVRLMLLHAPVAPESKSPQNALKAESP
jgi:uncharacterized protein (TIGR00369 family)